KARLLCTKEKSLLGCKVSYFRVARQSLPFPSAIFGAFTQASPRNSTSARFHNPAPSSGVPICTDFTRTPTGKFPSKFKAKLNERSSDKLFPFPIRLDDSQFRLRYGTSHNHSSAAM